MKITRLAWYKKILGKAYPAIYSRGAGRADMHTNGELAFLEWLVSQHASHTQTLTCFDVGANVGNYSHAVLNECRKHGVPCELHAFEPIATSFTQLEKTRAISPARFIANNSALSDEAGEVTMHYDKAGSSLASIYKRDIGTAFEGTEKIRTTTGLAYFTQNKISEVSLLKIDVEGHEVKVLMGFGELLNPNRIHTIQFEYGGSYRDSRTTLKEAYELLTQRGYIIGRLLADRVEIRTYVPCMEDFAYSNYIALDPALLENVILPTQK